MIALANDHAGIALKTEIKKLRSEMGLVSRDLKGSQELIRELEDQNQLLQTQLEAGKNFDSLRAEPLPGALTSPGQSAPPGDVPPPTSFWPAVGGQVPAEPVMTASASQSPKTASHSCNIPSRHAVISALCLTYFEKSVLSLLSLTTAFAVVEPISMPNLYILSP